MNISVDPHPVLDLRLVFTRWPLPLGEVEAPPWLAELARLDQPPQALAVPDDLVKLKVRDLLRVGGFKPAGRSKPCSEYIRAMTAKGRFPEINPAVDACNLACLHGGLPVSMVDADLLVGDALRIGIAPAGSSYVFNASGQVIKLDGLLCLFDADGPCANSVKDAQRTKTHHGSTRTLSMIWGTTELPGRADEVLAWYTQTIGRLGGVTRTISEGIASA